MQTRISIILLFLVLSNFVNAQDINNLRFIEVTGSAEKKISPDEIRFQIGIEEYLKDEFKSRKVFKDDVTLIPLEEIDKNLMSALGDIGITNDQIIIKEVGRHWNRSGKYFKKSKTIELVLNDFSIVDRILTKVNVRGVNSMRITALKNKDIAKYREQVKIEAMQAAKRKATYLLESVGEKTGKIISVIELNDSPESFRRPPQNMYSNTVMPSDNSDGNGENMRKIKLRYEVKIRFEIE
ncbi:MAG: SIMPL domain-containing protein [Bacteroidetes bacterium]|nr:MAG: SIMPL domain-containing protein [Bacteroidota bacterium]